MKWIGQHIWSLVTRFRNKVYFDEIPEEDATQTKALVLDGNGLIKVNSNIGGNSSSTTTHIHEDVKNTETFTMSAGTPVYAVSEVGASGVIRVGKADASNSSKMPAIGILSEDINSNSNGNSILVGVFNTNVSGFSNLNENQVLYVGVGGGLTNVKPSGEGNLIQNVGVVLKSNDEGTICQGLQVTVVGRTNDLPNLNNGNIFIGHSGDEYETKSLPDAIEDAGNITVDGDLNITGSNITIPSLPSQTNTDVVGVDSNGKLYRQAVSSGGGGGSITIVDDDTSTTFSSINEVSFTGSNIEVYEDGTGKVLVSSPPLTYAPTFNFSNLSMSLGNYRIATPVASQFYDGDVGGTSYPATGNTSYSWQSNVGGGFLHSGQASKIKVTVYGPEDTTSTGNSNELGSHTLTVNQNKTATVDGITITISSFATDTVSSKRKARVTVSIDWTQLISTTNNKTGSQKFSSVKIQQLKYNNAELRVFNVPGFFFDNRTLAANTPPTGSMTSFNIVGSGTKVYLSNIYYYKSISWRLYVSGISGLYRDTGPNSGYKVNYNASDGLINLGSGQFNLPTSGFTAGSGQSSSVYKTLNLPSNVFKKNSGPKANISINGGLGGSTPYSGYKYGNYANFNSCSGTSSKFYEGHRDEKYRISHNKVASYQNLSTAQSTNETTWKTRCVGHDPIGSNRLPTNQQHLIQGYHGNKWGLYHGAQIGTIHSSPSAAGSMTDSNKPTSTGTKYEYVRFFGPNSTSTSNYSLNISDITKSTFQSRVASGALEIHFMVPGNGDHMGEWIPLANTFQQGNPTQGCWANYNSQSSGNKNFDITFAVTAKILFIRIKMNGSGGHEIGSFTLSSGWNN